MTARRYFALVAESADARSAWRESRRHAFEPAFDLQLGGERLALVASRGAAAPLDRSGFILGAVFSQASAAPVALADPEALRRIVASRGEWLVRSCWGPYLGLLSDVGTEAVDLVRAPFGDLPCYYVRCRFGLAVASDVEMLVRYAGYAPALCRAALARHLALADLRVPATCLVGVSELMGGDRLCCDGSELSVETLWEPWRFTRRTERIVDRERASDTVGRAVRAAVKARAGGQRRILLRLSGGIDSSIVASSLASVGAPFIGLTLTTADRGGDERGHARAVARRLGFELVEAMRDPARVDLARSAAAGLPRPSARAFAQATTSVCHEIAAGRAISAIFDGGGGDNLFASLKSPAPVADCLMPGGGLGYFWRTARSIGVAAQTGTFEVARRAVIRAITRGPGYRWPVEDSLMTPEGREIAAAAALHPWLSPPEDTLPGSAAHVALTAAAQSVVHSPDPRASLAEISPLIAQPVAEACLRVPGWLWTRDGFSRAIARDAFRERLPSQILERRDKGAMDSFLFELLEGNRDLIRDMLVDGLLVGEGLVDRAAIADAVRPERLVKGHGYMRIMQLIDAEAWVRSWRSI